MKCRWVANSGWLTFGRRVVITSAVFGLTTIGGAGAAIAVAEPVGTSPSADVVSRAPMAVSVTFDQPLRSRGARMRVITTAGEVGKGKVSTDDRTLRRDLKVGAPGGPYTVEWRAVSASGHKMSGSFTFTAARGNAQVPLQRTSPDAVTRPGAARQAPAPVRTSAARTPGPTPTPSPTPSPTSAPSEPSPTPSMSWGSSPGSVWSTGPSWVEGGQAMRDGSANAGNGDDDGGWPGFAAVPLAVGALLVVAAGLVSLVNRRFLQD